MGRSKPLIDLPAEMSKAVAEFQGKWKAGQFPGWPKELASAQTAGLQFNVFEFKSVEDLMQKTDLNRLKNALKALGK